jgi:hypothetical protein
MQDVLVCQLTVTEYCASHTPDTRAQVSSKAARGIFCSMASANNSLQACAFSYALSALRGCFASEYAKYSVYDNVSIRLTQGSIGKLSPIIQIISVQIMYDLIVSFEYVKHVVDQAYGKVLLVLSIKSEAILE